MKKAAMHEILTVEEYKKGKTRKKGATFKALEKCKVHLKNEVKFYCDTCRIPICIECTVIDHRIPDHSHRYLQEVADECNKELSVLVEKLKVKAREVDQSRAEVKDACKKVTEQCMVNKQKIRKQKDALIDMIEKEERKLIERLDTDCSLQVKGLESDISDLELKYENLISTCSFTEALMHHGNAAQLVSKSQSCTVDNIPKCLLKGESINLQITTKDRSGKPVIPRQAVEVTLTKPDGSKTNLDVTDNRDGTHTVTANTDMDGKYQVVMTIEDHEVPGSPFENFCHQRIGENTGSISDDRYFMTDLNNEQVVVSDEDGKVITTFGQNELKHPRGISISPLDGAVYVSDWDGKIGDKTDKEGHCIRKYTQDGQYIKSFGKYGKENGEFKGPFMMVHDKQGLLFVADCDNDRIQVFNADDQFLYKFGIPGKEDGQLYGPSGICLDSDRYVYVSDYYHRIQKFDSSGRFISRVDRKEDELKHPED
ncbi:tripartite motif-containing protein 2-like [Ptychodera flava]|uniref:tripartite motif-containing protein 2-like n=1 Tax=Ptychodera flava TaxID=63121 RepID=UPI00396A7720